MNIFLRMNKHSGLSALKEVGFTLLGEGKTLKIRAEGFSMYPSIRPGSLIYIEPVDQPSGLEPGEIIAWKRDSGFVVHRLVRKIEKENQIYFVTRGDCNLHDDNPVSKNTIVGKVVKIESREGKSVRIINYRSKRPNYIFNRLSATLIRILRLF